MKRSISFGVSLALVWISISLIALGQQPPKTPAPPPKKPSPAAKAPARVTAPPPAPGTTRLYLAMAGYDEVLILRPPADTPGNCLRSQTWQRKLEGDLSGTKYSISLKARSAVPQRGPGEKILESEIPPGKIRASIVIKRPPEGPLPPHYVEKLREWAKVNVPPNAPPPPDPQNFDNWRIWARTNGKRPEQNKELETLMKDPAKNMEALMKAMQEEDKLRRASDPPELSALDAGFRKQGLPVWGETLLASTVFDTAGKEKLLTATLDGPDPEFEPGDLLVLAINQVDGYSCVSTDSDGFVYIDVPETPFTENSTDVANRVYLITGMLVTKEGAPVAGKQVLFLPVDKDGNGLTTFGPPTAGGTMYMSNPNTTTNAQGRFTLHVAASDFQKSADPTLGRIQMVEPMGGGRLRHVGKGTDVKLSDKSATRIDLGRLVVTLQ